MLLQVQARLLLKLETELLIRVGRVQCMVGVRRIRELLEVEACVFLQRYPLSRYRDLVTVIILTAVFANLCLSGRGSDALPLASLPSLLSILLVKEIDLTGCG